MIIQWWLYNMKLNIKVVIGKLEKNFTENYLRWEKIIKQMQKFAIIEKRLVSSSWNCSLQLTTSHLFFFKFFVISVFWLLNLLILFCQSSLLHIRPLLPRTSHGLAHATTLKICPCKCFFFYTSLPSSHITSSIIPKLTILWVYQNIQIIDQQVFTKYYLFMSLLFT